jgi:signal transduction histidine kinase
MYSSSFFNYYRIGRFIFALALLIAFQIAGLPYAIPSLRNILVIYIFIVFFRLVVPPHKVNYFDFLFDIVFISAMEYLSLGMYSYLTFIYLFPIFFGSVLIKTKKIFVFPIAAIFLYGGVFYIHDLIAQKESILNISLHLLAFSLIALAGDNLKERMAQQERYISRLEDEKIKMQGYERLYRISADLAHELRNPLASISAAAQFIAEGKSGKEYVDMLASETYRLTKLVNDFLMFARPSDAPKEEVNLPEMLNAITHYCKKADKNIILRSADDATIVANRTFMEAAVANIVKNAVEAAQSAVYVSLRNDQKNITIEIEDNGAGIEDEIKERIFEPFVTTKADGTGLGLAIAYRIITGFGGNIFVDRSSLGGAKFTIVF